MSKKNNLKLLRKFKVIDLFSGAGGFSEGFKRVKFKIAGAVEHKVKYAATHKHNFPDSSIFSCDIQTLPPKIFSQKSGVKKNNHTIIIGGPPCQTFSTIGTPKIKSLKKNGKDDPRNYLYKDFLEYVQYFKPELFIFENVPALKTKYKGKLFQNIIGIVDDLNYSVNYKVLNAVHYGVPQIRQRLFIVGAKQGLKFEFPEPLFHHSNGKKERNQLELFRRGTPYNLARTVFDAISDLPKIHDGIREGLLPYSKFSDLTDFQRMLRNKEGMVGNNVCRMSNERAKKVFKHMEQGSKYMDLPKKVRQILPFREDIFPDRLKRLNMLEPSWTVLAHIGMDGYMYIHPTENRTLSVREAARIQSFPDSFEFIGNMREQYIQVGNSVPPLLSEQLALSVINAINK
tara:strand:- start:270 stop:1469 length:1200 start_codon:yes stop_codon:yes gene_type:complete